MSPPPFDAVLFDLDGTLLATDRYWIPAARVGARRAFEELGLQRTIPSAADWMSLVGLPLGEGFAQLFSDLDSDSIELVMRRCVEEEHFALTSGLAALLPGVTEVLGQLQATGVEIGIASNCSREYLDSAMVEHEIERFVTEARCLDSPGIRCKADMIQDLLLTFGTRSAVMVGDRSVDRDAAHANALPYVHLSSGFGPAGEAVGCEALLEDLLELLPRLEGRNRWISAALEDLGIGAERGGPPALGVTGRSASGKSLFARDAARILEERGRSAVVVSLDDFLRADAPSIGGSSIESLAPTEHLVRAFDVDLLVDGVLVPHARGEEVRLERISAGGQPVLVEVPAGAIAVVEGLFLAHPRLRPHLGRLLHLEVEPELCLRRLSARELPLGGSEEVELARRFFLPAQQRFEEAYPPLSRADLVLNGANPLGPG